MNDIEHPSVLLKPKWVEVIRREALTAEQEGLLQAGQLDLIYQQNWFKLLVPKIYGGLEMLLPELIRMEEALSWADGSLGWVVTLCAGAGWFGGFINTEIAAHIFADPKVCLAGSGASTGTATQTDHGTYIINGSWKYASGVKHATQFTANCVIKQGEETVLNAEGTPLILPFVIDSQYATLIPAWKYVGMMGTGSHAFEINNLEVNANRCFKIDADAKAIDSTLYNYPFRQLAEGTLAANLSGMALHFVDLCGPIFEERAKLPKLTTANRVTLMYDLKEVKTNLQNLRNEFYETLDTSWRNFDAGFESPEELQSVSHTSRQLAIAARESVDKLYPYCGLVAASPDKEINQVWRDLHTASQHSLLTFAE
ncbi:acyl-CoA dehydrogenase family protein [Mucilaginibacter agri]|uniref:Acyl-CoA dehydrogenase n=1 Tax=Mucilaginibacter agri TaxID=2695265 RepID=A0A965ZGJ8_9SPHI|nr:acyl-CoA dehydrogenase [Mucilaginibacter agri]NCD69599.1 acyl-CoA dehydrogenase [Mucilaginibacter agri]